MSFVTVSYAQSIDGCIATKTGDSKWISSDATLELSQQFRRDHDAILVGIGTVLRDDPELTCRLPGCESPVRVILDSGLRIPLASKIVRSAEEVPSIVFCLSSADGDRINKLEKRGVEVVELPAATHGTALGSSGAMELREILSRLASRGLDSIYVEGGGRVITGFLSDGLVDRLVVVTAPIIIGNGVRAIGDLGVERLIDSIRPKVLGHRLIGDESVFELSISVSADER